MCGLFLRCAWSRTRQALLNLRQLKFKESCNGSDSIGPFLSRTGCAFCGFLMEPSTHLLKPNNPRWQLF
ncbi:hypothetical protein CSB90_2276 [Pseudomonas aeruginosa]|nr:hypothetical protein CSB90_2276 [Pseudomonas aeruginosa]